MRLKRLSYFLLLLLILVACKNSGDSDEAESSSSETTSPAIKNIIISQLSGAVTESGGYASFNIQMTSNATDTVRILIGSGGRAILAPSYIEFQRDNSNIPETITISTFDDNNADGDTTADITFTISTSDPDYMSLNLEPLHVPIQDDDTAGFTVSAISGSTKENGRSATFTVKLNTRPYGDVIIPLFSSDISEGTVSPNSLVFTRFNWFFVDSGG